MDIMDIGIVHNMTAHKKNKQSRAMPSLYKDTTSLKDIIKRSLRLSNDNNWSVKLSGGKDKSSGYIVIDSKNHTFGVCSKNWAMSNDDVICRQMGFDGAARQLGNERPANKMKLNGWTMRMHCYGYESRLQLCQVSKSNLFMNSIPCPDNSYVFVQCQKPCATSDPYGSPTICSTFECGLCNWKSTILHGNIGWNWFPKQESHQYRYSPLSANSLVAPPFAYVVRPPEYDQQMIAKLESPLLNLISKPLQIMIHYEVEGNDLSHYQIHAVDEHEHLINFTTVNLHAVSKNQLTKKSVIYPHHSGKVKIAFIVISLAVHKSHQSSAFILHDFIVSGAELNRNRSFMIGIGFVGFAIIFGIIGGVFYCIVSARREAAKAASEDQEKSKESSSGKSPDVELMEMISSRSRDVSTV
ncbi:uncharacterized protein TRIADDRAFT_51902 [Trichoplax adhaerens]|uniref:SRCR domain-containing protein n=1 Tax=Trichoplax adhaerens TaxID=10228 RepID=B3RL73_TRIAD|nr:hypothetical protein TRIADDRAFT_51902 [Trichoplax adhaerens]EDV28711.1 hypothetical protein TRIADDRAFT_51902 [Trichoplax adhaerens]|eukprot:XP_002107913.1 hypothetical protein TRIADDRAFT_51902 [Trichoplax adhaerens]